MLKIRSRPNASPITKFIIGVDVSLTSTGIAVVDNMAKIHSVDHIKTSPNKADHTRIDYIVDQFFERLRPYINDHTRFVFEAFAFSRNSGKAFTRAEVAGIIKYKLRQDEYDIIAVSPSALAKEIAGNGRCGKDGMMQAVFRKYNFYTKISDEADALAAAMYGHKLFIEHAPLDFTRHVVFRGRINH